ncbi:MAG: hypothetical protein U0X92_14025 [Anaerolineales bacterium]
MRTCGFDTSFVFAPLRSGPYSTTVYYHTKCLPPSTWMISPVMKVGKW